MLTEKGWASPPGVYTLIKSATDPSYIVSFQKVDRFDLNVTDIAETF
jgi:hypothetical protein